MSHPIVCLMGPTASGKSDLALALAAQLPCDIISVDSALVYRGMDIGSAKPDAATLARVPHALIDIRDPAQSYSAAEFCQDALAAIQQSQQQQRIPLLVGGTMLYYRSLLQGLSPLPSANAEVRRELDASLKAHGSTALHAELKKVDPEAAQRIHPNDPQRIQRALEVHILTGKPLSEHQQQQTPYIDKQSCIQVALLPPQRERLHQQISRRFQQMLEQGLVDEVQRLYQRGDLHEDMPAIRAVGYRQVWQYLDGKLSYQDMIERAITSTRQLAKRQLTWLRSWPLDASITCNDTKRLQQVMTLIQKHHMVIPQT